LISTLAPQRRRVKKLLAFAAGEKLCVAGIHLDFPTFGYVAHSGSAYRFIPDAWRPTV
jgi:hypothetical protein